MTNDCSYLSQFDKSNCDEVKRDEALIRTDCSALRCFFNFDFFFETVTFDDCAFVFYIQELLSVDLHCNACSVSTLVIKDLPALHCSITTKIQQVPMIQIVSTLLKPIRQKYPPAPSPSDADPPKMGHTDGRSHHPR